MKNFDWCAYTCRHRKAFVYVANKLIKDPQVKAEILRRAVVHDMDKMLMYQFLDQYESQIRHVQTKAHHPECPGEHTYMDLVETVIDYECAPYTKPDKPLNAYDFTCKLRNMGLLGDDMAEQLFEIMHEFGIDHSYNVHDDPDDMAYMNSLGEVTEADILLELFDYAATRPAEMDYIRTRLAELSEKER